FLTAVLIGKWITGFPLATLLVNILGSFCMGFLVGYGAQADSWNRWGHPLLMVGVLGGFTTFSSFSMDTVVLWERGQQTMAIIYVFGSVLLSLIGFLCGLWLSRGMFHAE